LLFGVIKRWQQNELKAALFFFLKDTSNLCSVVQPLFIETMTNTKSDFINISVTTSPDNHNNVINVGMLVSLQVYHLKILISVVG
jgi:hypothetical protein